MWKYTQNAQEAGLYFGNCFESLRDDDGVIGELGNYEGGRMNRI